MMSKILFSKLVREDMKRRSWLAAIYILLFLVLIPLLTMIEMDRCINGLQEGLYKISYVQRMYRNIMGSDNIVRELSVIFMALLSGISGFAYLHSKMKVDFYHSLPVKRRKWFFVQYATGILMYLAAYVISVIMCLLIGAVNGLQTGSVVILAVKMLVIHLMEYMAVYGTAILATVLTGKLLIAILGAITMAVYMPAWGMVLDFLSSSFFETYMTKNNFLKYDFLLSPVLCGYFTEARMDNLKYTKWVVAGCVVMVLWSVLTTGTAYLLNNIRKSESAEQAVAFSKIEGILKVGIAVPFSLGAGLYLSRMMTRYASVWFFGGIILTCIVICGLIEFIYCTNMREILHHKWQIAIAVVLSVLLAVGFKFDLMGYNQYLPAKDRIEQMAVYDPSLSGTFCYHIENMDSAYDYSTEKNLNDTLVNDFDAMYELAGEGAKQKTYENQELLQTIHVEFKLKNGKRVFRRYKLPIETVDQMYQKLFAEEAYKECLYPILTRDEEKISSCSISSMMEQYVTLNMTKEQRHELLNAYREELRNASYDEVRNHVVASLGMELYIKQDSEEGDMFYGGYSFSENGYPVGENFTKTLTCLKEIQGYELTTTIEPKEIEEIRISDYRDGKEEVEYSFNKSRDVKEIMKKLKYFAMGDRTGNTEDVYVTIVLKSGKEVSGGFMFETGNLPECFKKEEQKN